MIDESKPKTALVQLGQPIPDEIIAREYQFGLTMTRCDACPFGGMQKVNWDKNQHKCWAYKLDKLGRCYFQLTGKDVPDFNTQDGILAGAAQVLGALQPAELQALQMRRACGADMDPAFKSLNKLIGGHLALARTMELLGVVGRHVENKKTTMEAAVDVVLKWAEKNGGVLPDGRRILVLPPETVPALVNGQPVPAELMPPEPAR